MPIDFNLTIVIPATPEHVYDAWIDSAQHEAMTGGTAQIDPQPGGEFLAWDGYIWGKNLVLEPGKRVIQSWRTSEFNSDEPDSQIEVIFEPDPGGTKMTLVHTNLPEHGAQYQQGWVDNYFQPMLTYFSKELHNE